MKKINIFLSVILFAFISSSCQQKKVDSAEVQKDSVEISDPDTTIYGRCGEATTMHMLQLITEEGKSMTFMVDTEDTDIQAVKGGLLVGDRFAVVAKVEDEDTIAVKAININTLQGKWTSIDRNFEIVDGGEVVSSIQSESKPYTFWKIHNGRLILSSDTFDILTLGADSLELENHRGIFVYKRQSAQ